MPLVGLNQYKYRFSNTNDYWDGEYNIKPEYDSLLEIGDTITVNGYIINNTKSTNLRSFGVCFGLYNEYGQFEYTMEIGYTNITVKPGAWGDFSITCTIPEEISIYFERAFNNTNAIEVYVIFNAYNAVGGENGKATVHNRSSRLRDQKTFILRKFKMNPVIESADFDRVRLYNDVYIKDNEGLFAICNALKANIHESYRVSDLTIAKIIVENIMTPSEHEEIEIPTDILGKIISEYGYSEIEPIITNSYQFKTLSRYKLTVQIGDEYELAIYDYIIDAAFANLHLSGAEDGGVAIGGFSSATAGNPKFECYFPADFYGGFSEKTIKILGNVIYPNGAIYCGRNPANIFGGTWYAQTTRLYDSTGKGFNVTFWDRSTLYDPNEEE